MSNKKDKSPRVVIDALAEEKQRRDEVMQAALVPHQPIQTPDSLPIAMSDIKNAFGLDYPISLLNDVGGSGALPVGHLGLAPTPDPVRLTDYVGTPIDIVDQDWSKTSLPVTGRVRGVCWAGDRWVIGTEAIPSEFIWSYDGLTWQAGGTCPNSGHRTNSLAYNGVNIIAVSRSFSPVISSDKGATWREASVSMTWKEAQTCGINENFAVSADYQGAVYCSSDYGETWSTHDHNSVLSQNAPYFIIWAGDRWIMCNRKDYLIYTMDETGKTGWARTERFPALIYGITYDPKSGVLLLGTSNGTIYRVTDLDNITTAYTIHAPFDGTSITSRIEEMDWTGKEFVLFIRASKTPLYHSPDGINWSQNDKAIGYMSEIDQTAFIDHGWGTTQLMIAGGNMNTAVMSPPN